MTDRRQARILALQALCQWEALREHFLSQLDEYLADESAIDSVREYARTLVKEVVADCGVIDTDIQTAAQNWELRRMAAVDRNTLRVAVCELRHHSDVPPRVVMNEAIEIGKAFGTAESAGFINGVIDAVLKSHEANPPPKKPSIFDTPPTEKE